MFSLNASVVISNPGFRKRKTRQESRQLSMHFLSTLPLIRFLVQGQGDNADGCGQAKYPLSNTVLQNDGNTIVFGMSL